MQYFQAFLKLENSGISEAINELSYIPVNNSMTNEQTNIHQTYYDYINIIGTLDTAGLEFDDLSLSQKTTLYQIESNNMGPSVLARNTLIHADTLQYTEPIIFPSEFKTENVPNPTNKYQEDKILFEIYPNPTYNYITISHNHSKDNQSLYLEICYINGVIIEKHDISAFNNQFVFGLNDYVPGAYVCNLLIDDEIISSRKFIVIK
jgi:hypothetical protein